jgi:hypothetical protein
MLDRFSVPYISVGDSVHLGGASLSSHCQNLTVDISIDITRQCLLRLSGASSLC